MEKKRIELIDLAKGFCILLVVFNHIHETDLMLCSSIFRMPLYFFPDFSSRLILDSESSC